MRDRVVIESPYAGEIEDVKRHVKYVKSCVYDCRLRDEPSFASHLFYTQPGVLNDNVSEDRIWGIEAGLDLTRDFEVTAVYTDFGMTKGMEQGIQRAKNLGRKVEIRKLGINWESEYEERAKNHPHKDCF